MAEAASGSKPSAQELAALEQAFAQDPTSDAYRPLAEAYLSLGRFMEAMVVAKKGAKARVTESAPRLVLARIYAEQGKDAKAFEELQAALAAQPTDLAAMKMQAQLHFKAGQRAPGSEALLRAHAIAPADAELAQLMAKHGVAAAPVLAPAPPMPAVRAPVITGSGPSVPPSAFVATPLDARGQPIPRATRPPSLAPQIAYDLARLADEEEVRAQRNRGGRRALLITFAIALAGIVTLVGFTVYGKYRNQRNHQIAALLKKTQEAVARDSYVSYQEAEKSAQQALELDPTNYGADAFLAYINILRFGENGEGEDYLRRAQEYLQAAKQPRQANGHIFAAEAYLLFFSHHAEEAESSLSTVLNTKGPTGERYYQSNLLSGTLGIIQLQEGKLTEARKNLLDAHGYAAADVRVTAALGTVDARLGSPATASAFFQQALKIDPDHVPSLLGVAQLALESNPLDVQAADKALSHLATLGAGALSPRQSAFAKFMHAQLLYAQGKAGPASDEEKGALALDPGNAEMLLVAGRRLRREGQPDKAIALVRQAIALDPNRGAFYAELGEAYLAVPEGAANAVQQLNQAISKVPPNARLFALLAEANRRLGKHDQARESWERVQKIEPDNAEAHLGLARLFAQKGDSTRARAEYEAVAKHAQGSILAEADSELGRLALDRGDPSKARELFTAALGASASYAPPYFYVGKILSTERNKKPQARALFASYLKLQPEGPLASEARRLMK